METKLQEKVKEVLAGFPQYWDNNTLLKNKVIEDLREYKSELIAAFLSNGVYRLMKNLGIQSVIRKKRRYFGQSGSVLFPNRLNQQFEAKGSGQVFVTDITYVSAGNRFYYLSVIQDLFNNEVVAWNLSGRNDLALVMDTISKLVIKKDVYGAVIHSDQGFQCTSKQYNKRLKEYGVKGSHSRKGNPMR